MGGKIFQVIIFIKTIASGGHVAAALCLIVRTCDRMPARDDVTSKVTVSLSFMYVD
jgi:hypothetical protein